MAITLTLKGGEKDFDLIWDSAADVPVAVMAESIQEESAPRPLWHQPGGGDGNELVELGYDDARWPLLVQFGPGTDWSELLEELSALRRVIRQAHAHALGETWADEVYIECRPDTTASKTYYTVKLMEDRSGGFLMGTRVAEVLIDTLALTVTVAGDGYGDVESLNNAHRNGHMLVESATAGLASGLTVMGTPTLSLDTYAWLIGGQSQRVETDDSTSEGVTTAGVSITGGHFAQAYVWVSLTGNPPDDIRIRLQENTGTWVTLQTKVLQLDDTGGVSDKSYIDANDHTWYRVSVSGYTDGAATQIRLRVFRYSENASETTIFYVDGVYLEAQAAEFDVPEAWADYPQVYNRNDPDSTNPEYVNRFDVWGIPGDRPAWMELVFDADTIAGSTGLEMFHMARNLQAADFAEHLLDCDGTVDAWCNGGEFIRLSSVVQVTYWDLDPAECDGIFHVLLRAKANTSSDDIRAWVSGAAPAQYGSWLSFANTDVWEIHYLGLFDLRTTEYVRTLSGSSGKVRFSIGGPLPSAFVDCDYVLLLPANEGDLVIGELGVGITGGDTVALLGRDKVMVADDGSLARYPSFLGGVWEARAGVMNRFIFLFQNEVTNDSGTDDECRIDYDSELVFSYRPRTRGFLA